MPPKLLIHKCAFEAGNRDEHIADESHHPPAHFGVARKSRPVYIEITDVVENWIDDEIATISLLHLSPPGETAKIALKKKKNLCFFEGRDRSTGGELLQTGH